MLRPSGVLAFFLLALASFPLTASGRTMTETKLHAAAANNDVAAIEALVSQGAGIDARDGDARLLNGPKLDGDVGHASQDDIDAMFG